MFKKVAAAAVIVVAIVAAVFAGFDQYTSKTYTTLLAPTTLGMKISTASTTNTIYVGAETASASNSSYTGVDCAGLVGRGAVVLSLNPGGGSGVLTATLLTCATTNGAYATYTNDAGQSAWGATGTSAYVVIPVRPNAGSRYWRVFVTNATGLSTNASCGALMVTE